MIVLFSSKHLIVFQSQVAFCIKLILDLVHQFVKSHITFFYRQLDPLMTEDSKQKDTLKLAQFFQRTKTHPLFALAFVWLTTILGTVCFSSEYPLNWQNWLNSPEIFSHQIVPPLTSALWWQIDFALALDITGTTLILLAYICITPVKSQLNFLLVQRSSKNKPKTSIVIGGTVLSGQIGRQMLALQSFWKPLIRRFIACFYLSVMSVFLLNVYLNGHYLTKRLHLFRIIFWVAIFPINILYYCAGKETVF